MKDFRVLFSGLCLGSIVGAGMVHSGKSTCATGRWRYGAVAKRARSIGAIAAKARQNATVRCAD
jgi:hypothetical protein